MKDSAQENKIKRMSALAIWLDDYLRPWLFKVRCLFCRPSHWCFILPSNERLGEVTKIAQKHHISIRRANQLIMEELEDIVDQVDKNYRQRYRLLVTGGKKA